MSLIGKEWKKSALKLLNLKDLDSKYRSKDRMTKEPSSLPNQANHSHEQQQKTWFPN